MLALLGPGRLFPCLWPSAPLVRGPVDSGRPPTPAPCSRDVGFRLNCIYGSLGLRSPTADRGTQHPSSVSQSLLLTLFPTDPAPCCVHSSDNPAQHGCGRVREGRKRACKGRSCCPGCFHAGFCGAQENRGAHSESAREGMRGAGEGV